MSPIEEVIRVANEHRYCLLDRDEQSVLLEREVWKGEAKPKAPERVIDGTVIRNWVLTGLWVLFLAIGVLFAVSIVLIVLLSVAPLVIFGLRMLGLFGRSESRRADPSGTCIRLKAELDGNSLRIHCMDVETANHIASTLSQTGIQTTILRWT